MSDPRLLRRALRRRAKALLLGPALVAFVMMGWQVPWAGAIRGFSERRAERAELAPMLAEAEKLELSFPQVVVAHPAHLGKPVYWDVHVVSTTTTHVEGRPAWQALWTNPDALLRDRIYTDKVLARVAAVSDDAVWLDYLGRP